MVEAKVELLGILIAEREDFLMIVSQLLPQHHDLLVGRVSPGWRVSSRSGFGLLGVGRGTWAASRRPSGRSSLIPLVMVTWGFSALFALASVFAIGVIASGVRLWGHGGGCA
jgi:hypothetical protein